MAGSNPFDAPDTASDGPNEDVWGDDTRQASTAVSVTLKAGKGYDAPWVVFRGATTEEVLKFFKGDASVQTHELLKEVTGAGVALMNEFDKRMNPKPPRTEGRPPAADADPAPRASDDPPFADDVVVQTCKHGEMTLVEHKGQKGYVCPKGKKDPEHCPPVML